MKKIYTIISLVASLFLMSSCNDFLDRSPLDQVTPKDFFKSESHLEAYSIARYNFSTKGGWGLSILAGDNNTDNMSPNSSNTNMWVPTRWLTSQGGSIGFGIIRDANYFFSEVLPKYEGNEITGSETHIKHYIGEMYFIRAWEYFKMLKTYGDFPILTEVLPDKEDVLVAKSKREPRNEVARFILDDLEKAVDLMSNDLGITRSKNRLSKNAALLFRSRVALYEGSWLKYHAGTGRVPNGPNWPGKQLYPDYQFPSGSLDAESKFFFAEAVASSRELLGIPLQGQGEGLTNPEPTTEVATGWNTYYDMFSDVDLTKYDEVLFWRQYNESQNVLHATNIYIRQGGATGFNKGYIESFLMDDGRPIYNAEPNTYKGDKTLDDVKANRDVRLQLFMVSDNDRYDIEQMMPNSEPYYGKFGAQARFPYILKGESDKMTTGYSVRKGLNYLKSLNHPNGMHENTGSIIFRVAEAYLNFLEASYELNNTLNSEARTVWEKIRERVGMDATSIDTTIQYTDLTKEAKNDWGVYSSGEVIDVTLYNIRRERRCEFIGESMRWDDLYRWCAMNQIRNYIVEGFNLWDSYFERYIETDDKGNVNNLLIEPGVSNQTPNVSPRAESKYLRPYRIIKENNLVYDGYNFRQAKYLSPIPIRHIELASPTQSVDNSNFYQNPGWPTIGDSPAIKSNDPMDN